MNAYLNHLEKIEFVLTDACTGACKHCSQGDHKKRGSCLDAELAAKAVADITSFYPIKTVMVFGGEPLLYPEATARIMKAAKDAEIPHRQIITNGYFTKDPARMEQVAHLLAKSGVNDLLISVDAFHQETIPLETVRRFSLFAKNAKIPLRLQPAWLVSPTDENPYNKITRSILDALKRDGFPESDGNVVFPEGNARKYLAEYFTDTVPENPYVENPKDLHCLSVDADGSLRGQSLYEKSVLEIIRDGRA